jgi:opacity protein-like surface antigen
MRKRSTFFVGWRPPGFHVIVAAGAGFDGGSMRKNLMAAALLLLSLVGTAAADGEVTFVFGASISGDISVLNDNFDFNDVQTAVKNSPIFGLRLGSYGYPFGIEGSLVYSPSGLTGGAFNNLVEANASILYTEANAVIIIIPGPVSPFVTAGLGLHYLNFNIADLASFDKAKLGYNFGGGLKVNASRVSLRLDLRDHVTTFGLDDLGLGLIGNLIGLSGTDARLHNVELSFGLGIRF